MKTIKFWSLLALLALGACSTVTLIDESLITFRIQTTKNKEDTVEISWVKHDFYKSYDVLRSEQPTGIFQPISSGQTANQYIDANIQTGKIYYYKVKAYNSKGIGSFTSEMEQGFAGGDSIYPPKTVTASPGLYDDKVLLTWNKVEKSVSYSVRRSETGTTGWKIISDSILWTTYEDTNVVLGKNYDYQIIAVDKNGFASQPSQIVQGYRKNNPAQFSANAGMYTDYNLLTWKTPPNTAHTVIHRSDKNSILGSKLVELGKDAESYQDEAEPGSWYYTVRFYNADDYLILETSRQEGFRLNLTPKPQNARATKGGYADRVKLTWDAVKDALFYSIQRSLDGGFSWTSLGTTAGLSFEDTGLPGEQAKALYRVSATVDEFQGPYSDSSEGWAHRAPLNVRSQKIFGNRVELLWDESPNTSEYEILYSTSGISGPFTSAGISTGTSYTHNYAIAGDEQQLYYAVRAKNSLNVWSRNSYEDHSNSAEAWIIKAKAPTPLIANNKTASERTLNLSWAGSRAAAKYKIYRATLIHGAALVSSLGDSDYRFVGETPNYNYGDTLSAAPIRRYHYKVALVDNDGTEYPAVAADGTGSEIAYRLPVDVDEFMLDTDFNIIEAQMRIGNFGGTPASGKPKGRWKGYYDYASKIFPPAAISKWYNFSSFETVLNSRGDHGLKISTSPMGAYQNGNVDVSGLYTGVITYHDLLGEQGGWSVGGRVQGTYNHPNGTTITKTYIYTDAGFLQSVVLKSEGKPSYPSFEPGAGGSLQAGCDSPR